MSGTSIHEILLIGRFTRISNVQSLMQFFFDGEEFCNSIMPDEAVAYGAVLSGAGQALVGCHSSGSWCRDNNRGVMDTLIPRNTTIPIKIERSSAPIETNR